MDVLLSLPILSYFLSPSVTSWSTSLNLLFFYMTWSTLVLSHSPLRIELMGVLAVRVVLYLVPSLAFLLFDTLVPSVAESVKLGGASALPPRDGAALARTLGLVLANLAAETTVHAGLSLAFTAMRPAAGPVFKTATTLPLPWAMGKHLALLFAAREVLTYFVHRNLLHGGGGRLARWHARYAHARRAPPFSLLLCADHPVAYLLLRFAPLYLPALALRPHVLTFVLFAALATVEETLAMSGYSVVPGIIMGGITRRTALHCCGTGARQGNFGAWGLLDWACGTSLGRDVMADVRDEAEKHRLKEREEAAAGDGFSVVQERLDGLRKSTRKKKPKKMDS